MKIVCVHSRSLTPRSAAVYDGLVDFLPYPRAYAALLYAETRYAGHVEFMNTGYSATPLSKKLGMKAGMAVLAVNAPDDYGQLVAPVPDGVEIFEGGQRADIEIAHLFTNSRDELFSQLAVLRHRIKQDGSIWVSWYKKAAKLPSEITEDTVRVAAFPLGLVDVKVCAVDEKWSGLKLVIHKENRV